MFVPAGTYELARTTYAFRKHTKAEKRHGREIELRGA
jgi:hypothetical protein